MIEGSRLKADALSIQPENPSLGPSDDGRFIPSPAVED
jgi:hypothetical protein